MSLSSRLLASAGIALVFVSSLSAAIVPKNLKAKPEPNKLGLALHEYRLWWDAPDHTSFQVLVASDEQRLALGIGDLWDSGRRSADELGCLCRGKAFPKGGTVWWKVRCWDKQDEVGDWSAPQKIIVPKAGDSSKVVSRPTSAGGQFEFIDGKVGKALRLKGNSQISAADYEGLRHPNTTIAAWIKPERQSDSWQCIYRKDDGARRLLALGKEGPFWGLWCGFFIGGKYVEFGAPYDADKLYDGNWHHVAVTFSGGNLRLYIDGRRIGKKAQGGSLSSGGDRPAFIGSLDGKEEQFHGAIDDLRIYNRGLEQGEVAKLATGNTAIAKGLTAHWKFDGSTDNEAVMEQKVRPQRIVSVGGTLIYGMEKHGYFETVVTARWPYHDITFRNLGWPADDVFGTARGEFQSGRSPGTWRPQGGKPPAGYGQLLSQVRAAKPTTIIVGYGAEAAYAETEEQMSHFDAGYRRLIEDLETMGAKLVLVTPAPQWKWGSVSQEIPARNARLKRTAAYISALAKVRGHEWVDIQNIEFDKESYFHSPIELSAQGYRQVATHLSDLLGISQTAKVANQGAASVQGVGLRAENHRSTSYGARFNLTLDQLPTVAHRVALAGDALYHDGKLIGHPSKAGGTGEIEGGPDFAQAEALRQLIIQKGAYNRAKIRPLNKTYIFLFRRHEMGHFAHEVDEYEELIHGVEEEIALRRVPVTHRHEFRGTKAWRAPREYPDHEVPKVIPDPNLEKELQALKVADGFQVNLFASNPMVANPINLNWDVRGRAWVSTSSTYPHPRPGQKPNDRIVILEDTDRDGVADKHTVFADSLLVPHSVMPVKGGAYVCSATELLFLADVDGDDVSESRRVVFSGFGNADVHHMIHGLRWAPWGDLHFVQSIYINSFIDTAYGPRRMNGSGVWRFRPETGRLEPFATGMVNPWGFAFDEWGQSFGTDGAAGQGPHYVFPGSAFPSAVGAHRVLNGLIRGKPNNTGAEFVGGRHLPDHWQGSFLGNDFRANRTVRYELEESGSGYTAKEVETVLHSSHRSFRPVDIKVGPEGAIYVVDWYNAIIDHGEVDFYHPLRDKSHGRIWRITAKDRPLVEPPAIAGAPAESLLEMLKAPEPYTRLQAKRELASRPCLDLMRPMLDWIKNLDPNDPKFEHHRLEGLWLLMSHRAAPVELVKSILHSPLPQARASAVRAIANWDSRTGSRFDQVGLLAQAAEDQHPQVRLEAVNGLRGLGTLRAANVVLRARSHPTDNNLNYALELSVRQMRDLWLPTMQAGKRVFEGNPERLSYALKEVKDARAISRLLEIASTGGLKEKDLPQAVTTITALGTANDLEKVLAMAKANVALLPAIAEGARSNQQVPANAKNVLEYLGDAKPEAVLAAAELAGRWKLADARQQLVKLAKAATDAELLEASCQALARLGAVTDLKTLGAAKQSTTLRAHTIAAWARLDPKAAAQPAVTLLSQLEQPTQAALAVDAFLDHDRGALVLTEALTDAKLEKAVAIAALQRARASGREMGNLITALNKAGQLKPLKQDLTVEERRTLLADIPNLGDAARGREIFHRKALACATCHLIDNKGGKIGPDLTTIGTYATPDSLLESLLSPSTTIKQGYETVVVTKKDKSVLAGLIQRKTNDATLLRDPTGKIIAVPNGEIDKIDTTPVSLMPPGLTASLRRDELLDLMCFLTTLGKAGDK